MSEEQKNDIKLEQSTEALNLRSYKFYQKEVNMAYDTYKRVSQFLFTLREFEYGDQKLTNVHKVTEEVSESDKYVYIGETSQVHLNEKCGSGIVVFTSGHIYQGTFKRNSPNGTGRSIDKFLDYHLGNWENNKKQGYFHVSVEGQKMF